MIFVLGFGYLCKFVGWISCVSVVHCTWKPSLKNILQKWKHIQLQPWIKKVISKDDKNDDHRMLNFELKDYHYILNFELII